MSFLIQARMKIYDKNVQRSAFQSQMRQKCNGCKETESDERKKILQWNEDPSSVSHQYPLEQNVRPYNTGGISRLQYNISRIPVRIQGKHTIHEPGDQYEQEADRIAHEVLVQGKKSKISVINYSGGTETINKNSFSNSNYYNHNISESPSFIKQVSESSGNPLPSHLRSYFEPRFEHDFSQVLVHTGMRAAETSAGLQARAFTIGKNIFFGLGEFQPETYDGKKLIAHELVHVMQQGSLHTNNLKNQKKSNFNFFVQRHAFHETIEKFKTLVEPEIKEHSKFSTSSPIYPNYPLTKFGAFYISRNIIFKIRDIIQSSSTLSTIKENKDSDENNRILWYIFLSATKRNITNFIKYRQMLINNLNRISYPNRNKIIDLIGQFTTGDISKLMTGGSDIFYNAWHKIMVGRNPELNDLVVLSKGYTNPPFSLATAVLIGLIEKGSCGTSITFIENRIMKLKGLKSISIKTNFWDPKNFFGEIYRLKGAINIDQGKIVHARVKSVYSVKRERKMKREGEKPNPSHSLSIIGYDSNDFVYWDPDIAGGSSISTMDRKGFPHTHEQFGLLKVGKFDGLNILWAPENPKYKYRVLDTEFEIPLKEGNINKKKKRNDSIKRRKPGD